MAEAKTGSQDGAGANGPAGRVSLRELWPLPTLVVAAGLFVAGLLALRGPKAAVDLSVPLKEAESLVESGRFEEAIEQLNGPARAFVDSPGADPSHVQRFHLARARAFAGAQEALAVDLEPNHRRIISDYRIVEGKDGEGMKLAPADTARLASSLISVGEIDEALSRIGSLPAENRADRSRLTRRLIERNLASKDRRESTTLELLASLSTDPDADVEERSWVLAKQTELLLSLNRVEEAITKLLREIQRLRDVPPERQGELYVLLGQAYLEAGQPENAEKQLAAADTLLDRGSLMRADAALLLGRIAQNRGERGLEQARERYMVVIAEFRTTRAFAPALVGLAEVEAAGREFDRSLERYAEVVELIHKGETPREVSRETLLRSLLSRYRERYEDRDLGNALRFAQVGETLYGEREAPTPLVHALGQCSRDMADEQLEQARQAGSVDFTVKDLDPATRAEVKRHYLSAGDYFRRHAESVAAADPAAYAESLWTAADSFEKAGDLEEARRTFSTYADSASQSDPNRSAAKFRLAQIFQAQGDHVSAAGIYEELREYSDDPNQPQTAGAWADRSIVPLAMCYLSDRDPDNDIRAETLLKSVVDGSLLSPDAEDYREALVQLGNMYYAAGRYPDAIVRFEEVLDRYGSEGGGRPEGSTAGVQFKLADSHRLEAQRISATLSGALPQAVEDELKLARVDHLRGALQLYESVRQRLEPLESGRLPELERTFLRNASFYAGDCAFELGEYDRAIAAYDAAALKYADDPSSLVAMVQIVSAYIAKGQWAQARTANERARRQLARFPDEVWSRRELPMEKRHWERWLDARTVLERAESAAAPTP